MDCIHILNLIFYFSIDYLHLSCFPLSHINIVSAMFGCHQPRKKLSLSRTFHLFKHTTSYVRQFMLLNVRK